MEGMAAFLIWKIYINYMFATSQTIELLAETVRPQLGSFVDRLRNPPIVLHCLLVSLDRSD